jgi:hypothetical protein
MFYDHLKIRTTHSSKVEQEIASKKTQKVS